MLANWYVQLFIYPAYKSTFICYQTCSHTPPQPCPAVASITVMSVFCCLVIDLERTRCSQCLTLWGTGLSINLFRHLTLSQDTVQCPCHEVVRAITTAVTSVMVCLTFLKVLKWIWRLPIHLVLTPGWLDCNRTTQKHIESSCKSTLDALKT